MPNTPNQPAAGGAGAGAAAATSRKPIGLPAVMSELQFFMTLRAASKDDDRIPALATNLIRDFLASMKELGFSGGDDFPVKEDPTPPNG